MCVAIVWFGKQITEQILLDDSYGIVETEDSDGMFIIFLQMTMINGMSNYNYNACSFF